MSPSEESKHPSSTNNGHQGKYNNTHAPGHWKGLVPHTIYFYYFKKQTNGRYDNDFYFVQDPNAAFNEGRLRTEIGRLVDNAGGPKNKPSPKGGKFGDVDWNRISWLVVAVEGIELEPGGAAEIKYKKSSGNEENHSFFDGNDIVEQLPNGTKVGVIWAWNHMRDPDGNLLTHGQSNPFNFQVFRKRVHGVVLELDENGTNTGPTVRPPPTTPLTGDEGHGKDKEGTGPA